MRRRRRSVTVERDETGLRRDTFDPCSDGREALALETAVLGAVYPLPARCAVYAAGSTTA
jgi:hypothetical protein